VPSLLTNYIYGQTDGVIQPDTADGNPSEIAYSCGSGRLISLQGLKAKESPQEWNTYWDAGSWTNQWVKAVDDSVCEISLEKFLTVVPEAGGYVRLFDVAPLSPIRQQD
jgi:hypothetical protein